MEYGDEFNVWDSLYEEKIVPKAENPDYAANSDQHSGISIDDTSRKLSHNDPTPLESKLRENLDDDATYVKKVNDAVEKFERAGFFKDFDERKKGTETKEMIYKLRDEVIAVHRDRLRRIRDPDYDKYTPKLKTPMIDKLHEIREQWRQEENYRGSENSLTASINTPSVMFAWSSNTSTDSDKTSAPKKQTGKRTTNEMLYAYALKHAQAIRHKRFIESNAEKLANTKLDDDNPDKPKSTFKMDPLEPFVARALPRERKRQSKHKRKSMFWFWGSHKHHSSSSSSNNKERSSSVEPSIAMEQEHEHEDYSIDVLSQNSNSSKLSLPFSDPNSNSILQSKNDNQSQQRPDQHPSLIDMDDDEAKNSCSTPPLIVL